MKEDLLQYIWQLRLFDQIELKTIGGESIEIINPGKLNVHSGPDFLDARIKIGTTTWAGNVEIHLKTSDWYEHGHQSDPAYENLILHVVLSHDLKEKKFESERPILALQGRIDRNLLLKYAAMMKNKEQIPCSGLIDKVDNSFIGMHFQSIIINRLIHKTDFIKELLEQKSGDWAEVCYILTARYFGFNVNNKPFEQLARILPMKIIAKHRQSLLQVEALLFGQAGLLQETYEDQYAQALWSEYKHLARLYELTPMKGVAWKTMRLRPSNFPTIRIAQFANLVSKSNSLFSKIVETTAIDDLKKLFVTEASSYWNDHFMFDKFSPDSKKQIGAGSRDILLINVVAPLLFHYGAYTGNQSLKDRAIDLLNDLKAEKNKYTNIWQAMKIPIHNALESQAVIFLSQEYCAQKKCLECAIGSKILAVR